MKRPAVKIYRAAAIQDAAGHRARPGAVAVREGRVLAAGAFTSLPRRIRQQGQIVDLPDRLLMPAFTNAHAHLDLTHLPRLDFDGDFVGWLKQVIAHRPGQPGGIAEAVGDGLLRSRRGGVGCVGDVAGSMEAVLARREAGGQALLPGVSYLEVFGQGEAGRENMRAAAEQLVPQPFETHVPGEPRGVVLGLQPHAPYSAGLAAYEEAVRLSQRHIFRLTTHLAESEAELEFVRDASGPFRQMLQEMGKWSDQIQATGRHPVEWLEPHLRRGRWLVVHCNYLNDAHIGVLKRTGTTVVYCPLASEYFGHRGHRYQELLDAGVNVCLGTDAVICQPEGVPASQRLSLLPAMRRLHERDGTDPLRLLRMATMNGKAALEFHEQDATFVRGAAATFTAVRIDPDDGTEPLEQVLQGEAGAELIDGQEQAERPETMESAERSE